MHGRRDDAVLSTSELVTNVLLHADSDLLALFLWLRRQQLRLEVHDGASRPVSPRTPAEFDASGRGLLLLRQISDRWGSYERAPGLGKVVYAEFETA
ncbi:MAG TPA: ATP-binding protein [Yinghuangia sp.]|nr:ATP-binding protein [Yinghuangia sp.]